MNVPYVNLVAQWREERTQLLPIIESVLDSGIYVGGEYVERFEEAVSKVCGVRYAVALNSGTDALILGLRALGIGPGDEVITPPNSFVASTSSIIAVGARPIFVDVQDDQNIDPNVVEAAITPRTRAIMPVHLTGRVADMDVLVNLATKYGIDIIEDAAQSIGSKYKTRPTGSLGKIGCFSSHPLKNLNACGDGGFLTTDDPSVVEKVKLLRNHGLENRSSVVEFGYVSRMDTLQAAILLYRLGGLSTVICQRRANAKIYEESLDKENIFFCEEDPNQFNTYHTFVIQIPDRDRAKKHLKLKGIETAIHYPIPIHLQPAAKDLGYRKGDFPNSEKQAEQILTLPINQYASSEQICYVAETLNSYFT